jgi:PAS domain S-box-containing protein
VANIGRQSASTLGVQGPALRAIRASPATRYGIAIGLAVAAVLLRLTLDPFWGSRFPYITLFPAIMVSAWLGGLWPGIVTTAISGTVAQYFWTEPSGSWAVADKSELLGVLIFVGVGVVISALNEAWRRATDTVAQSEERLSVTLSSIGDAVIATDDQGRVTRLNAIAETLTGWTQEDAVGQPLKHVFVIINEHTREPAQNPVYRVLHEGVATGLANHTLLIANDGREIPIDDSAAPIRGEDDKMAGVIMVFRDITERRLAEREHAALLERERAARQETDRARRDAETAAQQLHTALQAGRMGTWQYTMATGDVKWSPGLEAIHGYSPGTFAGTFDAFRNEIHPADRDRVIEAIAAAAEQQRDHHVEYRIVRPDGAVRWVEGLGQVFCDEHGRPDRMVGVCTDITERNQAEERFRLAVEAAPAAMIMVDERGTIVLINALTEAILGYDRHEIVGQPLDRVVPPRFRERHPEYRRGFFADPRQRPMGAGRDLYALRKDGSECPVEIGLSPIETHEGRFVLAAVTDITERKQVEDERATLLVREQAARTEIERASRLKDEFLAVLSHELRTPLNAVLGYAHLLTSGALPADRTSHALNAIQRNAHAQARLVESLLDLSRVMAGKLELNLEPIDVLRNVDAALDVIRPEAEAKGIMLDVVAPPDVITLADGGRLQQVFWNLLSNAIKFTPRGGKVAVGATAQNGNVQVQITDNGQGISPGFLPFVFDRFKQADSRKGGSPAGLGLGLALAREIVQAHGGTVVAESAGDGCGSTFTVTLPLSIATTVAVPTAADGTPGEDVSESLPHLEILIVDDDGDVRDFLALLLESRGASVLTVSSATEALEAIDEHRPDVLLADLRMPEEDGYSLIRKLRAREREQEAARLPAIAVTAYASAADREQAIAAGYDWHMAKPFDPDALTRAIAKVAKAENV